MPPRQTALSPKAISELLVKLNRWKQTPPRNRLGLRRNRQEVAGIQKLANKMQVDLRSQQDRLLTVAPDLRRYLELRNAERDRQLETIEGIEVSNLALEIRDSPVKARALRDVSRIWKKLIQVGLVVEACESVTSAMNLTELELGLKSTSGKRAAQSQEHRKTQARVPRPDTIKRTSVIQVVAKIHGASRGRELDSLTSKELDQSRVETLSKWEEEFGVSTWTQALRHPKLRGRVQKLFSAARAKAQGPS